MKNKKNWFDLDNAAKIFPPTSNKRISNVFRLACELYDNVDPIILQEALDKTIIQFPIFLSVLKKGLFWYYFENSNILPLVEPENLMPCFYLYDKNIKQLLFRVSYFNKRINLEIYHALTDGTGAVEFLKALVLNYLMKKYHDKSNNLNTLTSNIKDQIDDIDSFNKYYNKADKFEKLKVIKAYRIKSPKCSKDVFNMIEGVVSVRSLLNKAHKYNTTVTVLLTALIMKSIEMELSKKDKLKPISVTIPINLRKYFESRSIRNFFGIMNIRYKFDHSPSLKELIKVLDKDFKEELTKDKMQNRINNLVKLEHNLFIRPVPLFIKDLILKIVAKYTSNEATIAISNIGKISMPDEVSKYIKLFDVFVTTDNIQLCVCSYLDNLTLSITSIFKDTNIQKNFFKQLTNMNINVVISTTIPN